MEWLKIFTTTGMLRIKTDEIVFVKADGNYSDLMLTSGSSHKMTFQLIYFERSFKQLRNNTFVRVGRSLIVNKRYIYIINLTEQLLILYGKEMNKEIVLRGNPSIGNPKDLTLSRESLKQLMEQMKEEKGENDNG